MSSDPSKPYWLAGRLIDFTAGVYPTITLAAYNEGRKRFTFSRNNCQLTELVQRLAAEHAHAAFYFRNVPEEKTHAVDFTIPRIGVPGESAFPVQAGELAFQLNGDLSPFFVGTSHGPVPHRTASVERLQKIIQSAQSGRVIAVIADADSHEVMECFELPAGSFPPRKTILPLATFTRALTDCPGPRVLRRKFLMEEAQGLMDFLLHHSCREGGPHCDEGQPGPNNHCPNCLPYCYPDSGCEARAYYGGFLLCDHDPQLEGDLFMVAVDVRKIFCSPNVPFDPDSLHDPHNPDTGQVSWDAHVALAVEAAVVGGLLILDPTLRCTTPVTIDAWRKSFLAPNAIPQILELGRFEPEPLGDARIHLQQLRNLLDERIFKQHRWPPYHECAKDHGGPWIPVPLPLPLPV